MRTLATLALLLLPVSAFAQELPAFEEYEEGEWDVYRMDDDPVDCWIVREGDGGLDLTLSVQQNDDQFYVSLDNPAWQPLTAGKDFDMVVRFGGIELNSRETGDGTNHVAMLADGATVAEQALLGADSITVTVDGRKTFESPLDATARRQFHACIASMGGINSKPD